VKLAAARKMHPQLSYVTDREGNVIRAFRTRGESLAYVQRRIARGTGIEFFVVTPRKKR
jgi:hypothetical protein